MRLRSVLSALLLLAVLSAACSSSDDDRFIEPQRDDHPETWFERSLKSTDWLQFQRGLFHLPGGEVPGIPIDSILDFCSFTLPAPLPVAGPHLSPIGRFAHSDFEATLDVAIFEFGSVVSDSVQTIAEDYFTSCEQNGTVDGSVLAARRLALTGSVRHTEMVFEGPEGRSDYLISSLDGRLLIARTVINTDVESPVDGTPILQQLLTDWAESAQ